MSSNNDRRYVIRWQNDVIMTCYYTVLMHGKGMQGGEVRIIRVPYTAALRMLLATSTRTKTATTVAAGGGMLLVVFNRDCCCFCCREMAILVILGRFWSVWHPADDAADACFIIIFHCDDGPNVCLMISEQFLSNGGGLIHRTSKVTADYRFWRC
uniref:Uncharacterized protein n=1 Tax=Leptocylindrus danicus TaxID=163516 RepID=A0A7S2KTU1_9STRA|mmetsp:Transcript_26927/g.39836  ORF Transcript_26927/g.39836 Transcript_26927/m.39836 type:complete len:155 (+) Transcript_26927:99-563(+)